MVKRSPFTALVASLAPAGLLALSLAACGDLLGLKDLELYPSEGGTDSGEESSLDGTSGDTGTPAGDSGSPDAGDATSGDSPSVDAPEDTSAGLDAHADTSPAMDGPAPPLDAPEDTSHPLDSSTSPDGSCTTGSQTDKHNCGSCGHDCLGGACQAGVCQPFVLATGGVTAYDLISTGGSLYWVDEVKTTGAVWTCSIASCNPHTLVPGQNVPERITQSGGTLYWSNYGTGGTNDGSIVSQSLSGGAAVTLAQNLWTPDGIATDGSSLFWAEVYNLAPTQLVRYSLSAKTTTAYLPGGSSSLVGVAVGGGTVYWTDTGTGNVESSSEALWPPPPVTNVATGESSPWALSVDSTYVYWVDYASGGAVWQSTIGASSTAQISSGDVLPIRVASDAAHVYWIDRGSGAMDGALVGCDPASCSPATVQGSLAAPISLAMDSSAVYFATLGDSSLHMMVR